MFISRIEILKYNTTNRYYTFLSLIKVIEHEIYFYPVYILKTDKKKFAQDEENTVLLELLSAL
jgi:hypothetical protein